MQGKNLITVLESVDSTNNYAMGQIHAGVAAHGQAWLALEQTQGKGQRGKHWKTAKGVNITMSMTLQISGLKLSGQFRLSAAVAAACHAFVHAHAGSNTTIKWPNDIYWNDSKAGGILIENILQGQVWKWAVIGLGMNVNEDRFPEHLPNPTSLRMITGQHYPLEQMAAELQQKILFYWQQLVGGNWQLIFHYYNNFLYKKGKTIRINSGSRSFTATLKGISEDGQIEIAENEETFGYDEVKVDWQYKL